MKLWIGASGFPYSEWKGSYSEDLPTAKMLPFYAERFATRTEINYTFHRIPARENDRELENANARRISVRSEGSAENHSLVQAARLFRFTRILLQSHHRSWRPTRPGAVSASADLQKRCGRAEFIPARGTSGYARSVEFRHESWFDDEIFELLKSRNIALCIADTDTIASSEENNRRLWLSSTSSRRLRGIRCRALD